MEKPSKPPLGRFLRRRFQKLFQRSSYDAGLGTADDGAPETAADVADFAAAPTPGRFEDLPVDIHLSVLQALPGLSDLHALIAASPACLTAYRDSQHAVLRQLVQRALPPELLPLALQACAAPTPPHTARTPRGRYCNDARQRAGVAALERTIADLARWEQLPPDRIDAATWARLARLLQTVDGFVDEYAQATLARLRAALTPVPPTPAPPAPRIFRIPALFRHTCELRERDDAPSSPQRAVAAAAAGPSDEPPALSATERARCQRAFLRFELYRKLYLTGWFVHGLHPGCGLQAASLEALLARTLLAGWPAWARDEQHSVVLYLRIRLVKTLGEMDAYLQSDDWTTTPTPWTGETFPDDLPALISYRGRHPYERCFAHESAAAVLPLLGLPFLRNLWRLDKARQLAVVRAYAAARYRPCSALAAHGVAPSGGPAAAAAAAAREREASVVAALFDDDGAGESLARPNAGWAFGNVLRQDRAVYGEGGAGPRLAVLGTVFWDAGRLQRLGFFAVRRREMRGAPFVALAGYYARDEWARFRQGVQRPPRGRPVERFRISDEQRVLAAVEY